MTNVVVNSLSYSVDDCTLAGGKCSILEFVTPDTTADLPPVGLAGPARITVRDAGSTVVAEIAELSQPTGSCDREPETVFRQFTVLPPANVFADVVSGAVTELLATVDGGNNLLVPFDYWGEGIKSVLAEDPGSPVAIFLEGGAELPAQGAGDPDGILDVIAAQPSPFEFVRSFTLDGRPLPPLLRVTSDGELFGTADAVESVLRFASNDGKGGPNLFDVTDRLFSGRGPIVIDTVNVARNDPVPLKSIQASPETVAFARNEFREGTDLNLDGDMIDLVVQIVNTETGEATNTGKAVTEVPSGFFIAPALVTSGESVAFLESEVGQGDTDLDLDGDTFDNILRVFDRGGTELTADPGAATSFGPRIDGRSLAISGQRVFARNPGSFIEAHFDGVGGVDGLANASGMAVAPDGAHVYATGLSDNAVAAFSRNPSTGALTFVEAQFDGIGGVDGLGFADAVAVSPDGAHVYVTAIADRAVAAFSRSPSTGALTFVEALFDGVGGVDGLDTAEELAVSPDGAHVYVAGRGGLAAFSRDPSTGALTFVEAQFDGIGGVDGLDRPNAVAVSPDGMHVYVTGLNDNAVAVFSRNPSTGALTFVEAQFDGMSGVDGLLQATHVTLSPDGAHVYVTSSGEHAVAVFSRNPSTGALTFVEAQFDGIGGVDGLSGAIGVAVTPDGARVYVAGVLDDAVAMFSRNPSTGALTFVEAQFDGIGGVDGLRFAYDVAISPDGAHMYATGRIDRSVAVFHTHSFATVFDTEGTAFLPQQPVGDALTVAAERAVITTPEFADDTDRNDDLDAIDQVAQLYDASVSPEQVTNLRLAASRVAISSQLVALAVPEGSQADTDRNGDGDTLDDVLAVFEIGTAPPPTDIGTAADAVGVTGTTVVFITPEAGEDDTDLNNDLDADDRVIRSYDHGTGAVTEIGQAAEEFVLGGSLVAFRTSEAAQDNTDLNDDGDMLDMVMQVYDLATGELINTEQAAILCSLPGCVPTIPYKINGETVSFLTDEVDQSADLNGDGDMDDIVLTVFSVNSRTSQTLDTVEDDASTPSPPQLELPLFPDDDAGDGTIVLIEAKETEVGEAPGTDINDDGDLDDVVVLIAGDRDDDGTFDDFDSCVEAANDSQVDVDGDGLGDGACDPDPTGLCAPAPLVGCLVPTQPGKSLIAIKDNANDGKDGLKWKWSEGEATELSAFGDPVDTTSPVYALCVYDASASEQPLIESAVRPGGACGKKQKPCWRSSGSGLRHKDKSGEPGGIQAVGLRAGAAGRAAIKLKAKGALLDLPSLSLDLPVTVQFVVTDGDSTGCWETTYGSATRNDAGRFKAKGP